jgi:hypothetical protein
MPPIASCVTPASLKGGIHNGDDILQMMARSQFRNDTAYFLCTATCEPITLDRIERPSRNTAAAVLIAGRFDSRISTGLELSSEGVMEN